MKKISSFTVDHDRLERGIYISRIDGDIVTYDLRMRRPNAGDYITPLAAHSLEHLLATYMRSGEAGGRVIYVGPMGCRTGFYLLLAGDYRSRDVVTLVRDCFHFIGDFRDEVPGASAKDCGNYLDMNLPMANYWGGKYAALLENIDESRLVYPK